MKKIIPILLTIVVVACNNSKIVTSETLIETDKLFSLSAEKTGFKKAFVEFAHTDAVLLRENSMPIVGKTAIEKLFEKADTTGIDFSWEPLAGDIAASGDLGYTYGVYTIKTDSLIEKGTYVSIWEKDESGEWKYVLETGNEGIWYKLN